MALVVGGAPEPPGAVLLAGIAAMRAGAAAIQLATVRSAVRAFAVALPNPWPGAPELASARGVLMSTRTQVDGWWLGSPRWVPRV